MMTDAFKSIEQGLKEAIANGATTHHVVIDLVTRLRDWEHIYSCDDLKPDGHLYVEAAERIQELEANLAMAVEALEYYNDTLMIPTNLRAFDILAKLKGEI